MIDYWSLGIDRSDPRKEMIRSGRAVSPLSLSPICLSTNTIHLVTRITLPLI